MSSEGGTWRDVAGAALRIGAAPDAGQVALVSGGDEGVGSQLVRWLSALGMRVVLGCRSVEHGRLMIDRFGPLADRVVVRRLDVTDANSVERLVAWVTGQLGRCDVLVCNLTLRLDESHGRIDLEAVRDELWTQVRGIRQLAHAVAPMMRACGYGRVVTVRAGDFVPVGSDVAAHRMTRSAIDALTRSLPEELGCAGILANAYCPQRDDIGGATPSAVETPLWLATLPDDGPTGHVYG